MCAKYTKCMLIMQFEARKEHCYGAKVQSTNWYGYSKVGAIGKITAATSIDNKSAG